MTKDRVLIVDDSQVNRLVLRGHLEAAGFEVAEASSGDSALAIAAGQEFELAVIDILMPGMDGYEVCRRLRARPAAASTPVLFLTALGERDTAGPARESGADGVLGKPFHRAELLLRIRALIQQRQDDPELG